MTERFLPNRNRDGLFQADVERAVGRLRGQIPDIGQNYSPSDTTKWADPPPTTVAEALDRLAKAITDSTSPP